MEINLELYKVIPLPNGNILLKLKKDIDSTPYNLVLTDASFYKACKRNIAKINIYEPTNLTKQLLKIIVDETTKMKSVANLIDKIRWIKENMSPSESTDKLKSDLESYTNIMVDKVDSYVRNIKKKIKNSTLIYLFASIIANVSGNYLSFGQEFFLLKLLNQYFPDMKLDYKQIYMIETRDDIDIMCEEKGGRYYELVQRLCAGDKKAFNGNEIDFFPSPFEISKQRISGEIFPHIQDDIYDDGDNWEDYDPTRM